MYTEDANICTTTNKKLLSWPSWQVPRVEKKVFGKDNKDNNHNSLHLTLKNCPDICPWALSVPRGSQDSSNFNLLSGNCSRVRGKNLRLFFRTKWKLQKTRTYRRREHMHNNKQKTFILAILARVFAELPSFFSQIVGMVFENVDIFSWILNAISIEKNCLISKPFLTCLLDVRTLDSFPTW